MSLIQSPDARHPTDRDPLWTSGPAGWLTLFTMPQLIGLLNELAGGRARTALSHGEEVSDVGHLVRHEVLRREWSID
jgi:hypothetical protein